MCHSCGFRFCCSRRFNRHLLLVGELNLGAAEKYMEPTRVSGGRWHRWLGRENRDDFKWLRVLHY